MSESGKYIPADTTLEAWDKQAEILRNMPPHRRAEITFELSNTMHTIAKAGIRHRHPDYSRKQVDIAYFRLILEPDIFEDLFGKNAPLP
jgi:hypothetical protein